MTIIVRCNRSKHTPNIKEKLYKMYGHNFVGRTNTQGGDIFCHFLLDPPPKQKKCEKTTLTPLKDSGNSMNPP